MDHREVFTELFDRITQHVNDVVDGLDVDQLCWSPGPDANPIGWLVWHLTRVQDHHIADLADDEQIWAAGDWSRQFGLEPDPNNTGYGHSTEDVATIRPDSPTALRDYYAAVAARTSTLLDHTSDADLDRIVDQRWDPPVTLGVRLISIVDDSIQHAGQARYVRGLLPT